jgi:hypothetical protein
MDFCNPDGMKDLYQSVYISEEIEIGETTLPTKEARLSIDLYDTMIEFLCVEGYADTLEDAEWIMANCLIGEDLEAIVEGKKEFPFDKVKKQEYRHTKKSTSQSGGSRGTSKNRASKMSSIRGAVERGEDPRSDGYGGARAARGNPPEDHRAAFSKNPLNNPPRKVKKPGV